MRRLFRQHLDRSRSGTEQCARELATPKQQFTGFSYSIVPGALRSDLIARLRDLANTQVLEPATSGRVLVVDRSRRDTSAFDLDREAMPELYEHVSSGIECANRVLGVTTTEFEEPLRYLRYAVGGHFGCHADHYKRTPGWLPVRKLSFTVPLSRPDEYDGGDLELFLGSEPIKMPQEPGSMIVFPSFLLHRVKPVSRGVRRSLVGWMLGPACSR